MVNIEIAIFLGVIGAAMGSFAGAVAWRIHKKRTFVNDRSECESCHQKLGPLELIPVVSWLAQRGLCKHCGAKIGVTPLVSELVVAALFVLSYVCWPLGFGLWQAIALFVMWLLYVVALAILVIYDARWMLLPDKLVFPLIGAGFIDAALHISLTPGQDVVDWIIYTAGGVTVLAGLYAALYVVSNGKWVGFGDVKLSIFIGAVLGWQRALLVLFLANIIAFLVVAPGLMTGKLTRTSRVPFGPFLIVAFLIAGLFGDAIITAYMSFIGL